MKKTPLFRALFANQFLPACPKTGKRPTKRLKISKNWEEYAFYPLISASFSHVTN